MLALQVKEVYWCVLRHAGTCSDMPKLAIPPVCSSCSCLCVCCWVHWQQHCRRSRCWTSTAGQAINCADGVADYIERRRCMCLPSSLLLAVDCIFTVKRNVCLTHDHSWQRLDSVCSKVCHNRRANSKAGNAFAGFWVQADMHHGSIQFHLVFLQNITKAFHTYVDWYTDLQIWSMQRRCEATPQKGMRCRRSVSIILSMAGITDMACRDCFAWQGVMCDISTASFAAGIRLLYLYVLLQVPKANAFV